MNQSNRAISSSSSTRLYNRLNFELKFNSFGSWIKFIESIVKSSLKLCSSWFGSLLVLVTTYNVVVKIYKK